MGTEEQQALIAETEEQMLMVNLPCAYCLGAGQYNLYNGVQGFEWAVVTCPKCHGVGGIRVPKLDLVVQGVNDLHT